MDITFVNHASVLIRHGQRAILSDPWYFGSAFHDGWSLLYENPDDEVAEVLERTSHIWLSHEHPDHFSVPFFKKWGPRLRERRIPFLFQKTEDHRVAGFIRAQGLEVIEIPEREVHDLGGGVRLRVVKSEFYDSALLLDLDGFRVFNLNDCPIRSDQELAVFRAVHGPCDLLLTQFSYAAWKGGRDNKAWRQEAAREKLDIMRRQAEVLEAKAIIPFASFVRFSNALNGYLNDSVNTPDAVAEFGRDLVSEMVIMRPLERQSLASLAQDPVSLDFWRGVYQGMAEQPVIDYPAGPRSDALADGFRAYRKRIFANNSAWMIRLLGAMAVMGAFQPVTLELIDRGGARVTVDFARGLRETPDRPADIRLHSASLDFIFKHDFGFDTLTVNGCFEEAAPGGFQKMAKLFAIGNLNAMGIHLTPAIAVNAELILMFLGRLRKVAAHLKA